MPPIPTATGTTDRRPVRRRSQRSARTTTLFAVTEAVRGEPLKIVTTSEGRRSLVQLIGRFDAHETPGFRSQVEPLLAPDGGRLTIDLSTVAFLDSTALAELLRLHKMAKEQGGELTLVAPSEPVRVILELTALQQVFSIEDPHRTGAP